MRVDDKFFPFNGKNRHTETLSGEHDRRLNFK